MENNCCCICMDDILNNEGIKCYNNHNIHKECYNDLLKHRNNSCPTCRLPFTIRESDPLGNIIYSDYDTLNNNIINKYGEFTEFNYEDLICIILKKDEDEEDDYDIEINEDFAKQITYNIHILNMLPNEDGYKSGLLHRFLGEIPEELPTSVKQYLLNLKPDIRIKWLDKFSTSILEVVNKLSNLKQFFNDPNKKNFITNCGAEEWILSYLFDFNGEILEYLTDTQILYFTMDDNLIIDVSDNREYSSDLQYSFPHKWFEYYSY